MAGVERLLTNYEKYVRLPWEPTLAGAQKIWFAVYAPADERRLRARIGAFETATVQARHSWLQYDLTDSFPEWMAAQEYRDAYYESPEDIEMALEDYAATVTATLRERLQKPEVDEKTVFAVIGLASLFGMMRASRLIESVAPFVRGRLLVFFPGERDGANYRLLDARDGWNYLAIPITSEEG
jgi:hypothetical protein